METTELAEVVDNYKRVVGAIPDLQISVRQSIWRSDTRTLVIEQEEHGTNTADFSSALGVLPAPGRAFHMRNVLVMDRTGDGLVTDMREYFDLVGVMRQLGAM